MKMAAAAARRMANTMPSISAVEKVTTGNRDGGDDADDDGVGVDGDETSLDWEGIVGVFRETETDEVPSSSSLREVLFLRHCTSMTSSTSGRRRFNRCLSFPVEAVAVAVTA